MKRHRFRPAVLALVGVAVAGCGLSVGPTSPRPCVDVSSGPVPMVDTPYVGYLAWEGDGRRLIIDTLSGPFAASTATDHLLRMSYLDGVITPWFDVDAHGIDAGPDGAVHWLAQDGLWARASDGARASLVIPIEDAPTAVRSWTVTMDRIFILRAGGSGAIDAFTRTGVRVTSPFAADPSNVELWASWDASQAVITRVLPGRRTVYDVIMKPRTTTVDPGIGIPEFKWLAQGGRTLMVLDYPRGLTSVPVDGSAGPTLVDSALPADYRAITIPTSTGLIAYSDMEDESSLVCFATLPASAAP